MKIKYIWMLFFGALFLNSCIREDYFGESEYANIKNILVSNQSGNAVINNENALVVVEIPAGVDLSQIKIETLELSSFAKSDVNAGDFIDLNGEVKVNIISENGTTRQWTIKADVASATPQLDNYDLNLWYSTATNYEEPGQSAANTIWGTGNRGTQLLNKLATKPITLSAGNRAAQMETLDNGPLGNIFGAPISSGSIFTGFFNPDNIDPANPEAAIEFGTPFTGRPEKLQFKYNFQPGAVNKDKQGNVLSYGDACDIYAILEVRKDGVVKRLATAWFRGEDLQNQLVIKEVIFTYGSLDSSFPAYMKPKNNLYVDASEAAFILPTHITFVASSSFAGAQFAGAIGSKLVVDDVKMIYD